MELRATKINSIGCLNSCWCRRKLSRSKRRARVRCTAPPIFRLVTTPNLGRAPSGSLFQLATRQPCANRSPSCRMRRKSRFWVTREARPRRRGFGVWAVMDAQIRQASSVYGLRGGGCAGWLCRSWSNYDSEIRAAACGGF